MELTIKINTESPLSALDTEVLLLLANGSPRGAQPLGPIVKKSEGQTEAKKKTARKGSRHPAEPAHPADAEETEAPAQTSKTDQDENPSPKEESTAQEPSDAPTLRDAVKAATELLQEGKSSEVKEILKGLGVKKVSALTPKQIPAFLEEVKAHA